MQAELPEINSRIKHLIDVYADGNVAEFVRQTGISSHQVLNRIFNIDSRSGKYPKPSNDIISRIQHSFPEINANWLLTGKGSMQNPPKNPFSQMSETEIGESVSKVLMEMYKKGEIYPASIYEKAVSERDKRIEELQRRIWELEKMIESK